MFILLFRYLKRKSNERKARKDGTVDVPPTESQPDTAASSRPSMTRAQVLWNIALMVGLVIPVFLETLDYTGKRPLRRHSTRPLIVPPSGRNRASPYCCMSSHLRGVDTCPHA